MNAAHSVCNLLSHFGFNTQCFRKTSCVDVSRAAIDVTVGLEVIHNIGVVHCDVKPGNILLVRKPNGDIVAKIADLGEAKGELWL